MLRDLLNLGLTPGSITSCSCRCVSVFKSSITAFLELLQPDGSVTGRNFVVSTFSYDKNSANHLYRSPTVVPNYHRVPLTSLFSSCTITPCIPSSQKVCEFE